MNSERHNRVCKAVVHRDAHSEEIAKEIVAWMREVLFTPLLLALEEGKGVERENSLTSAIAQALRNDEIAYHASTGQFLGRFSAEVVRELRVLGATYHGPTQSFFLPASQVPYELRGPISDSAERSRKTHAAVLAVLAAVVPNMGSTPDIGAVETAAVGRVLSDLERQVQETLGQATSLPEFTDEDRRGLVAQVQQRLAAPLREFVTERAGVLRRVIETSMAAGAAAVQLATVLEHEFGVAKRRARLLAEHETALLIAKFREVRYKAAGVTSYAWDTRQDERVRPGHAALHGRVFSWDSPPIVDPASGRRCHPGEDYNCRCSPLPIIVVPTP